MSEAFITGSHAYGSPTEDSDVDLVVLMSPETHNLLVQASGDTYPVRFGKLNLIMPDDEEWFNKWKVGTECLVSRKQLRGSPIGRDEAIELFQSMGIGADEYGASNDT